MPLLGFVTLTAFKTFQHGTVPCCRIPPTAMKSAPLIQTLLAGLETVPLTFDVSFDDEFKLVVGNVRTVARLLVAILSSAIAGEINRNKRDPKENLIYSCLYQLSNKTWKQI